MQHHVGRNPMRDTANRTSTPPASNPIYCSYFLPRFALSLKALSNARTVEFP